jgi:hypothetical protein
MIPAETALKENPIRINKQRILFTFLTIEPKNKS